MRKFILSFLLAALMAGPVIAQDSEAADPAEGLSIGTPLETAEPATPEDLAPGQPYAAGQSGDWIYRCLKAPEGEVDPCQLYQLLKDGEGNDVAEISIFPLADSDRIAAGATFVVPLETLLNQQLTLSVDGSNARRYPFTYCNTAGCVARVGFTAEEVNQFKRGNEATLTLVPLVAPDQKVDLKISLAGFTAGFDNFVEIERE